MNKSIISIVVAGLLVGLSGAASAAAPAGDHSVWFGVSKDAVVGNSVKANGTYYDFANDQTLHGLSAPFANNPGATALSNYNPVAASSDMKGGAGIEVGYNYAITSRVSVGISARYGDVASFGVSRGEVIGGSVAYEALGGNGSGKLSPDSIGTKVDVVVSVPVMLRAGFRLTDNLSVGGGVGISSTEATVVDGLGRGKTTKTGKAFSANVDYNLAGISMPFILRAEYMSAGTGGSIDLSQVAASSYSDGGALRGKQSLSFDGNIQTVGVKLLYSY